MLAILENYSDEEKARDVKSADALLALAVAETKKEDNYVNRLNRSDRAKDRVDIVKKIEQYEREGRFDEDVEADPPGKVLMPEDIDYLKKGYTDKLKTKLAFMIARRFVNSLIDDKKMIIKEIRGIENFKKLNSGAIITCNHFNAFDSFAIQLAYEAAEQSDRKFYRIIREGNYTSFPGFYGFLMRHCNTLPLSSNRETLKKFTEAVDTRLKEGHFVLIYPEQSMWWNYRKPKPLKTGAYMFAAKSGVPVLPCFITMKDSDIMGDDGYFVQEYTIHISSPIYPEDGLNYRKNMVKMMEKNAEIWKEIYESEYHIPLTYTT
jgi:1-acyl-sn-glycerol-3-phosphate acyltransferase